MIVLKRIASILTVIVFAVVLACTVGAYDIILISPSPARSNHVYYASELLSDVEFSSAFNYTKITEDGNDLVRVTANQPISDPANTFIKFNLDNESKDVSAFWIKEYPFVVVRYRTDIAVKAEGLAINAGMEDTSTGAYERFWGLNTAIVSDERFRKAIFDLSKTGGYAPSSAGGWDTVSPESGVSYIRIPVWAYTVDKGQATDEYFDIEYIGFFKTLEDAKSFGGYDEYSEEKYTVTFIAANGSVIRTDEAYEGVMVVPPKAPTIAENLFVGWRETNGTVHTDKIRVNGNMRLTAQYGKTNLTDKPFITGYEKRQFKPDNNMTRAEACTVIVRLLIDENKLDSSIPTAFSDLNKNSWYYKYITYLEQLGYLKSYIGEFKPDQKITRAEFVELVYNMGKISGGDKIVSFKDVPADHPRYDVITAAARAGLVNGKTADTFDPDGNIKRSEVVKVLCTALGRIPSAERLGELVIVGFSDVAKDHWAYPYIIESAYEHTYFRRADGVELWGEVIDNTEYLEELPEGLVDTLNKDFAEKVAQIRAAESEWTLKPKGKVIYVSMSDGDDNNSGLSPESPIKTLAELMKRQNGGYNVREQRVFSRDVVLLKRGDEWHEKFSSIQGVTYSAYGEGDKPRILGSIEADNPEQWVKTNVKDVYKYIDPITKTYDVGNIVFDNGYCYGQRIVKQDGLDKVFKVGRENIASNGLAQWRFLADDYTFSGYKDLKTIGDDIPEADLMFYHDRENSELYIYSKEGNPGDRFESIELCVRGHAFTAASGVTIDNLFIGYTGSHGISSGTANDLIVRNCEIGWIGGSVQAETNTKVRFGNAVEIYGVGKNFQVYDNFIYQCFDCGPTIQVNVGNNLEGKKLEMKDVSFYGNALWEASLEIWFGASAVNTEDSYAKLINVTMHDNYVTMSGYGWKGYNHTTNREYTSFYGAGATNAEFIDCYAYNNKFWNVRWQIIRNVSNSMKNGLGFQWFDNVFIHRENAPFGRLAENLEVADGRDIYYLYTNDNIRKLLATGAIGINEFYKLPAYNKDNEIAPSVPQLPLPDIDVPFAHFPEPIQ